MTTFTEGRHTAEYILSEASGTRSREVETLAQGHKCEAGTVLGRITASGKCVPLDPTASDGGENAVAILFDNVDAAEADRAAVVTARDTEVRGVSLVWPEVIDDATKKEAVAALEALGIIIR